MADETAWRDALDRVVRSLEMEHRANCPARMRETCTCPADTWNVALVQMRHRMRDEAARLCQRTPAALAAIVEGA